MSDNILDSIDLITDCIEDAQDSNMAIRNLLEDLDDYLSLEKDSAEKDSVEKISTDIKEMIDGIIYEVDVASDKINVIHQHLDTIAEEVSEED